MISHPWAGVRIGGVVMMIELLLVLVDLIINLVAYTLGFKTWDELREERRAKRKAR